MSITIPTEVAELVLGLVDLTEDVTPIEEAAVECLRHSIYAARAGRKVVAQS